MARVKTRKQEALAETEAWEQVELDEPAHLATNEYIERNRAAWDRWAPQHAPRARKAWEETELRWGLWDTPESELQLLRDLPAKTDAIELGCGTAAISEYGASVWCNPRRWLPEAHRLLRPEGQLIFFTNGAILMACTPTDGGAAGDRLVRDYFSKYRVEFPGEGGVEFHLTHGHWVRLLRSTGFVLENLIEVRPLPKTKPRFALVSLEWARRWPSEEIWVARKVA